MSIQTVPNLLIHGRVATGPDGLGAIYTTWEMCREEILTNSSSRTASKVVFEALMQAYWKEQREEVLRKERTIMEFSGELYWEMERG